jgi:acetyl-CoA carboxylase/biotin carboxylase 1
LSLKIDARRHVSLFCPFLSDNNSKGGNSAVDYVRMEGERLFVQALDALETAMGDPAFGPSGNNQVFLNFLPTVTLHPGVVGEIMRGIVGTHGKRIWDLNVRLGEMSIKLQLPAVPGAAGPPRQVRLRYNARNTSQFALFTSVYREVRLQRSRADSTYEDADDGNNAGGDGCSGDKDPAVSSKIKEHEQMARAWKRAKAADPESHDEVMAAIAELPVLDITEPYEPASNLELRRFAAQRYGSTYVYDIPEIMERALARHWRELCPGAKAGELADSPFVSCRELVMPAPSSSSSSPLLVEVDRPPCQNTFGMVAWRIRARTPECPGPEGREVIVIANDITFRAGSFAVEEDEFFERASRMAREAGVPRVYFSCNSGARLALADEVQRAFQVAWLSGEQPAKGFRGLYLDDADLAALGEGTVQTERVTDESGETRNMITTVVGAQRGIGVENLRASGTIAGETSRAYNECFTLTIVTGRSVGIGAYLVRLGQRTIQCQDAPILLTGEAALNKVLGRAVYTSNLQLGGPGIMFPNGVSHLVARDLRESIESTWRWIGYVPEHRAAQLPRLVRGVQLDDPVDRDVTFAPTSAPYDPRHLLCGDGKTSGLFDAGSFMEVLAGWARTVVAGRARLGGAPVGVIATELRTVERVVPADPASPTGQEEIRQQAGQVWYPDSAFKTAQAIRDVQREGLPLFILASWRGFSGGRRDMYEEVLKYGAQIVDALAEFTQPVFVYMPPHAELRGGAWVVLDPTINPGHMEMHADQLSRAGILEPSGIVEIKYREPALVATMRRLDPTLRDLYARQKTAGSAATRAACRAEIDQRVGHLLPIYGQVATSFAELHDTPQRMLAVGAIDSIVAWKDARRVFSHRLSRRLAELEIAQRGGCKPERAREMVRDITAAAGVAGDDGEAWAEDRAVCAWLSANPAAVDAAVAAEKTAQVAVKIREMMAADPALFESALASARQ